MYIIPHYRFPARPVPAAHARQGLSPSLVKICSPVFAISWLFFHTSMYGCPTHRDGLKVVRLKYWTRGNSCKLGKVP